MEVSKNTSITTHISVTLTSEDIKHIIRTRFNLSSTCSPAIDYSNTINGQIKVTWSEYSTSN